MKLNMKRGFHNRNQTFCPLQNAFSNIAPSWRGKGNRCSYALIGTMEITCVQGMFNCKISGGMIASVPLQDEVLSTLHNLLGRFALSDAPPNDAIVIFRVGDSNDPLRVIRSNHYRLLDCSRWRVNPCIIICKKVTSLFLVFQLLPRLYPWSHKSVSLCPVAIDSEGKRSSCRRITLPLETNRQEIIVRLPFQSRGDVSVGCGHAGSIGRSASMEFSCLKRKREPSSDPRNQSFRSIRARKASFSREGFLVFDP